MFKKVLLIIVVISWSLLLLGVNIKSAQANNIHCPDEMVWIPGGSYTMGSNEYYANEKAVDGVRVSGFCMDRHEVTNADFAIFVKQTGYITVAERSLSKEQFPDLKEEERTPGSVVFQIPQLQADGTIGYLSWWKWVPGVNWQHPEGPDSNIQGRKNHPVVHIAYEDAEAYGKWRGKLLPTEAQWEFAGRGGLKNKIFGWGNQYSAKKANTWQGKFPLENTEEDGYFLTAPVGSYPPNQYGLFDMTGNVWEWTRDWYRLGHDLMTNDPNPIVADANNSFDPREPNVAKHVLKGGSFLCARNYCSRYRPAAREAQSPDTGMSHIGFRLVK